ncbi:MAG: decaprenyl-phosphate phosphoribosyltransferase [Anaerolineaceae bacterium]
MLKNLIETMRPRQWTKNFVIFAGLVFDRQLFVASSALRVLAAFFLFCLVSGLTYTINDIIDLKADRHHPQKCHRPIASGRLSLRHAVVFVILLSLVAFSAAFLLSWKFGLICITYTLLMLAYSKWLKHIMLVDVMVIAIGFLLRVFAGISVIEVTFFSPWLFFLTALLALFLGFGKRFAELRLLEGSAGEFRKVLDGYSIPLLNQYLEVMLASILITYMLYSFSAHPQGPTYTMMLTTPFVFFGIFRYMYLIQNSDTTSTPEEVLLKDHPLQAAILLWVVAVMLILYL